MAVAVAAAVILHHSGAKAASNNISSRMIRLALLAMCLTVGTHASISDCGSAFQITQLALSPDPPVQSQPVFLNLVFNNNEAAAVSGGTATTSITLNGLPISPSTQPLCEATACPIPQGANNRSTNTTWPAVSGKIISRLTWEDSAGKTLLCLLTQVKVASALRRQQQVPQAMKAVIPYVAPQCIHYVAENYSVFAMERQVVETRGRGSLRGVRDTE